MMWPGMMQISAHGIIRDLFYELEDAQHLADTIIDAYRSTFHPAGLTPLTDEDEITREVLENLMWSNADNHARIANEVMPTKEDFLEVWRRQAWEHVRREWYQNQKADQHSETEQEVAEMDVNSAYPDIPIGYIIPDFPEDIDYGNSGRQEPK